MSMIHKAFVFDDDAFRTELCGLLMSALQTGNIAFLRAFIEQHRSELSDPCEGAPLERDWESQIEVKDAHQYGELALTKYFDPTADLGLSADWHALGDILEHHGITARILLGTPLYNFDPGKQGSYFQTSTTVSENLHQLDQLICDGSELAGRVVHLRSMFGAAASRTMGLYVTF